MTLKEELEILRGEPIPLRARPEDVPCIETSDSEKLCKHPVVSVHMITYNHEHYIRQAIEGVMMQKTDFEFELVIGEDASTDKTREICFEYQKRYPDKIRVLWSEKNVNNIGGNTLRVNIRCRGEFIAFCEGDDYWTDPLKLQKQVSAMRNNPSVGLCFAGCDYFNQTEGTHYPWNKSNAYPVGVIPSKTFQLWHLFGKDPTKAPGDEGFIMTATAMVRRANIERAQQELDIYQWRLSLSDSQTWLGATMYGDAYFIPDTVAVYRQVSTGVCQSGNGRVWRDAFLVRFYFYIKLFGGSLLEIPDWMRDQYTWLISSAFAFGQMKISSRTYWTDIRRSSSLRHFYSGWRRLVFRVCLRFGIVNRATIKYIARWVKLFSCRKDVPKLVRELMININSL